MGDLLERLKERVAELEAIVENQEEILDGFDKALNRGIAAENPDRYARWAGALYASRVIIKAAGDEDPIALIEAANKLRKTADGAFATPGLRIYPLHPVDEEYGHPDIEDAARLEYCITDPLSNEFIREDDGLQIETCFSTREAAEQARGVSDD